MSEKPFVHQTAPTAAGVLPRCQLRQPARDLLQPSDKPADYVARLVARNQSADAIKFLAATLPPREAVWWACLCAQQAAAAAVMPPDLADAVKIAVLWVNEPTEERREPARVRIDQQADFGTTAGCLTLAVAAAGPSLLGPTMPAVPSKPSMTPKAVAGCIQLLAVAGDSKGIPARKRDFIELGIGVATGATPPPQSVKPAGAVAK